MRCHTARRFTVLVASGLLLLPSSATAADDDIQFWPVLSLHHAINDRWGGHLQTRVRLDDDVSEVKDDLVRPFVSWEPADHFALNLGYDYLHSYQSRSENRIWQAGEHRLRRNKLTVKNRIRFDERFVEGVDGVVLRFRYRLRTTHPIAGSKWYGVLSDEIFFNLTDQDEGPVDGFEQNRLRFATGVPIIERLRVEAGYEYQYDAARSGPDTRDHTFFIEISLATGGRRLFPFSPP